MKNNFRHEVLLTNTQVLRLRKAFANNSSANIKLLKTYLHKIGQSGGILGRVLVPLLNPRLPLMKNLIKFLILLEIFKSVLILLVLTTPASATHAAIHRKIFGPGTTT